MSQDRGEHHGEHHSEHHGEHHGGDSTTAGSDRSHSTSRGNDTSFRQLLVTLVNETVAVELSGDDTTKIGKLIDVDSGFITVAVTGTTGTGGHGGGHTAILLAFIPLRHIVSIVES